MRSACFHPNLGRFRSRSHDFRFLRRPPPPPVPRRAHNTILLAWFLVFRQLNLSAQRVQSSGAVASLSATSAHISDGARPTQLGTLATRYSLSQPLAENLRSAHDVLSMICVGDQFCGSPTELYGALRSSTERPRSTHGAPTELGCKSHTNLQEIVDISFMTCFLC